MTEPITPPARASSRTPHRSQTRQADLDQAPVRPRRAIRPDPRDPAFHSNLGMTPIPKCRASVAGCNAARSATSNQSLARSYTSGKILAMKSATRLTSKGQVVIPKRAREQLRWSSGTQLAVEGVGEGAVRLTQVEPNDPIDSLYGCLKGLAGDPLADLETEHQAEVEADERWRHGDH